MSMAPGLEWGYHDNDAQIECVRCGYAEGRGHAPGCTTAGVERVYRLMREALRDAQGFVALVKFRPEYVSPAGIEILAKGLSDVLAAAEKLEQS